NMTAVIEPFYPKAGIGRRPYPLETMLRIHSLQHWYNLSDGAIEEAPDSYKHIPPHQTAGQISKAVLSLKKAGVAGRVGRGGGGGGAGGGGGVGRAAGGRG
ncbi:transposase, partial [Enterobacter asburiae]